MTGIPTGGKKGERLHGFEHPRKALSNAESLFGLTPVEKDIILHHMWPLTLTLPATPEARVVMMVDKLVSLLETFRLPIPAVQFTSGFTL